jgi:hypothetical protein
MTDTTKARQRLITNASATMIIQPPAIPLHATDTEWVRADHCDALIAAALIRAEELASRHSDWSADEIKHYRTETMKEATAALDRVRQEARKEALREAADRLNYLGCYGAAQIVLALITKDQANE